MFMRGARAAARRGLQRFADAVGGALAAGKGESPGKRLVGARIGVPSPADAVAVTVEGVAGA
jgi:hypothetical protein